MGWLGVKGVTLGCVTGQLYFGVVVTGFVGTLGSWTGSDFFLRPTSCENILLRASMTWYWRFSGAW